MDVKKIKVLVIFISALFVFSCKMDEFKINEITIKDDWSLPLVSPMLHGNNDFKDFIYDWDDVLVTLPGEKMTVLEFPDGRLKNIPTRIIFEPSAVIDSFYFLIKGEYELSDVSFKYIVSNGSPFPFNFQMEFFDRDSPALAGPAILPPPFEKGDFTGAVSKPFISEHTVVLNNAQFNSFVNGDRIKITTWYDRNRYIDSHDTLKSNYPVKVSVIVMGKIKLPSK